MLNIVDKYTAETPSATEDGVVAIEYVLMAALAAAVVAALTTVMVSSTGLSGALQDIINRIV